MNTIEIKLDIPYNKIIDVKYSGPVNASMTLDSDPSLRVRDVAWLICDGSIHECYVSAFNGTCVDIGNKISHLPIIKPGNLLISRFTAESIWLDGLVEAVRSIESTSAN